MPARLQSRHGIIPRFSARAARSGCRRGGSTAWKTTDEGDRDVNPRRFSKLRRRILDGRNWVRLHGHHVLFGFSLLCLVSLLAWWTVFINQSVHRERDCRRLHLALTAEIWACKLAGEGQEPPSIGRFQPDDRFEVVSGDDADREAAVFSTPDGRTLAVQPRSVHLAEIENKYHRQRFMVIGEGAMLACLLLVSSFVLFRLIDAELRSSRELQEFWCRVTHEIKTPITGLKAFLDTLNTQELSKQELSELVALAQTQVERQRHLAQNILSGQRFAGGKKSVHLTVFSLLEVFDAWLAASGLMRPPNRLVTRFQPPSGRFDVWADPDAVRVIVDNLVDNAVKYAPHPLTLEIRVEEERTRVILAFTDNGPGFDPKMAENLFQAFRRFAPELPSGVHGTGMGLHISRKLARAMGGELSAQSDGPGCGATFVLSLNKPHASAP